MRLAGRLRNFAEHTTSTRDDGISSDGRTDHDPYACTIWFRRYILPPSRDVKR